VSAQDRDAAGSRSARNRSAPGPDRLDTEVLGLRLDAATAAAASPSSSTTRCRCGQAQAPHLRPDVAGALERLPRRRRASVVFVNGAEGDVAPRMVRGDPHCRRRSPRSRPPSWAASRPARRRHPSRCAR
jgi:hypothetical protein